MRHLIGASLAAVTLLAVSTASAQTAGEKIGQVAFPISCNPAVQKPFERGVALLHSFWYLESVKAFTAVTQADPDCAMGYWGIAMSLWYQIWSPPSPANLKRGWEAVEKAKAAPTKTQRERDWVAAAEAFYKDARQARPQDAGARVREGDGAGVHALSARPRGDGLLRARAAGHR